jgi:hypothetical protein
MTRDGGIRYHHARSLSNVFYGIVGPVRLTELVRQPDCSGGCDRSDVWHSALHMEATYRWLADQTGFWPLFLAVGQTDEDRRMTAYQLQFSRTREWDSRGPIRDRVLFSYRYLPPGGVFTDYLNWHIPLNSVREVGENLHELAVKLDNIRDAASVLRSSWSSSRWLRHARTNPGSVQLAVPELDLGAADQIWVPNRTIARALGQKGFDPQRIIVRRLAVN